MLISKGNTKMAKEAADFYSDTFGDDFFMELIRYPTREVMSSSYSLASFAQEQGIPIVATNNVHYAEIGDYRIKELLNAIDQNIPVSQLAGFRTVEQYLKSPREMVIPTPGMRPLGWDSTYPLRMVMFVSSRSI